MRLHNKTAIVTGAASGIGKAISTAFVRQGANICLLDSNEQAIISLANELSAENPNCQVHAVTVDISAAESVAGAVAAAEAYLGDTHILVNCAATQTPAATVEDLPIEEWTKAFAVNVTGTFLMSKAVLPRMRASGGGVIIHIASQLGSVGIPGFSAYCATKGALLQLTKTMALDHAKDNIRVNSLSPGATLTERLRTRYGTDAAAIAALGGGYPMGRLGTAEEVANAAVFLASDDSSFVTGADLLVDGGYLAR